MIRPPVQPNSVVHNDVRNLADINGDGVICAS